MADSNEVWLASNFNTRSLIFRKRKRSDSNFAKGQIRTLKRRYVNISRLITIDKPSEVRAVESPECDDDFSTAARSI
ncbi:MAG: hypothetical protein CBE00_06380 [Planctomycetaceae bacterium TMED240]|nr:hypothetical protein [Rhodopirellula sp.]OUX06882.1 MAG: hypothetical protein CBE00_06380 [Planctomycetaceae bacterium TMED240]